MPKFFAWILGLLLFSAAATLLPGLAHAQTLFCPLSVTEPTKGTNNPGIRLKNGACTNPLQSNGTEVGAFSGAALAGQAVGNLAQSMSIVQIATTARQIEQRRNTEAQVCPAGETFIDGECRPTVAPVAAATPVPVRRPAAAASPVARLSRAKIAKREKTVAPPIPSRRATLVRRRAAFREANVAPAPVITPVLPFISPLIPSHFGAWAQGYGDYEERSGRSTNQIQCCATIGAIPLELDASSRTRTAGFVGGIDWTSRSLFGGGDGLILGVTTGYLDSEVKVTSSVVSTAQPSGVTGVGNGFGTLRAHLSGPSVGAYATYFNGPWSNDFLIKNDFLSLNESFTDLQAYQTCSCFPAFTSTYSGSGKASLNQFTVADNVNYRIPFMAHLWMEPTFGLQYTLSSYSGSAAALGLSNGDLVRIQGGSRVGGTTLLGNVAVTTVLTGLVYDDVLVTGDFVQGGVFGTSGRLLNDEGKLRGEGILNVAFDFGAGRSAFVQGDVRGGDGLFGAGGKAGFRLQW